MIEFEKIILCYISYKVISIYYVNEKKQQLDFQAASS